MEKCKLRAKSFVYWPGIYKEIESLVNSCCVCQKYHSSQQKEPMILSEIPSRPWQTVSADLFYVQQAWFLVIVDYYSKFPFVMKLHNLTARAIVKGMKMRFAENGIPRSPQCDNGTQFTSGEFQLLASQFGFEIVTSSKNQEEVRNWLKVRQDNQSCYYNRHTKELPKLHRDQAIYEQDPVRKTWNPARVVEEGNSPRSYIVETATGAQLRRNRIHLRP